MSDLYELQAKLAQVSLAKMLAEQKGDYQQAATLEQVANGIGYLIAQERSKYSYLISSNETVTITNIETEAIKRIQSDQEFVQFIFEELDAASHGNNESRKFVADSGIDQKYFMNALDQHSTVDREGGAQQLLNYVCILAANNDQERATSIRIKVVTHLIELAKNKGLLDPYLISKASKGTGCMIMLAPLISITLCLTLVAIA